MSGATGFRYAILNRSAQMQPHLVTQEQAKASCCRSANSARFGSTNTTSATGVRHFTVRGQVLRGRFTCP
jgi:hypothetical protein